MSSEDSTFLLGSPRVQVSVVARFLCTSQSETCQAFSVSSSATFAQGALNMSVAKDADSYGESEDTLATAELFKTNQIGHSDACQLPITKYSP